MKVVQCWDDGVANDIRLANLLRKYGAKATFNLCPGAMRDERIEPSWDGQPFHRKWNHHGYAGGRVSLKEIKKVYDGFELASHCWGHENAGAIPDDVWIESALKARRFLEDIAEKACTGFAWPCGRHTPETARLLRENGFAYGRTTANTDDLTKEPDPMRLSSSCHFLSCDFWDKYEKAKETGIFYFWGHSYEMYDYGRLWDFFEEKLAIISRDKDAEWANVADIVPLLGKTK